MRGRGLFFSMINHFCKKTPNRNCTNVSLITFFSRDFHKIAVLDA